MRAVLQRVSSASVVVNGGDPRTIGPGLMILLGGKGWRRPRHYPQAGVPNAPGCAFLPMMRAS